ncbi:MAG: methylmalonyl-CoA epimerase [Roseiflexaceae bacterium]|nr:methylmalonyl-CoA epimerase [Roseiflexaceae bacterium]
MMFTHVDHLGFAVNSIEEAIAFYRDSFGVAEWEILDMPERHMRVAVARVGGTMLELIAPTSPDAAFAKYLAERGAGMHHVAYRVDDIMAALDSLRASGVRLIDEQPRPGLHNTLVAFVHPKAAMGVLIELVQHV